MKEAKVVNSSWVKQPRLCEQFDHTDGEIRSKIQRGVWQQGLHYAIIDGRRRFNTEAISQWITQQASDQAEQEQALKSDGSTISSHTARRSQSVQERLLCAIDALDEDIRQKSIKLLMMRKEWLRLKGWEITSVEIGPTHSYFYQKFDELFICEHDAIDREQHGT